MSYLVEIFQNDKILALFGGFFENEEEDLLDTESEEVPRVKLMLFDESAAFLAYSNDEILIHNTKPDAKQENAPVDAFEKFCKDYYKNL